MRTIPALLILVLLFPLGIFAQTGAGVPQSFTLSTDLLAYTTPGGYSIWGIYRRGQNQAYLAWVKYPEADVRFSDVEGFNETRSWMRLGLTRYLFSEKLKGLYAGVNLEYYWRKIEEDATAAELKDTYFAFAPILGYQFSPFKGKTLHHLSFLVWGGVRLFPLNYRFDRVFTGTGSVYPIPAAAEPTLGLNIGWSFDSKHLVSTEK